MVGFSGVFVTRFLLTCLLWCGTWGSGWDVEEKSWELLRNQLGPVVGHRRGPLLVGVLTEPVDCRIQDNGSRVPAHRLRKLRQ